MARAKYSHANIKKQITMKHIVVVDIDGTIAKIGDRLKYITHQNPKDYDAFYDHCDEDNPIKEICNVVWTLAHEYDIVFCTGRAERCRKQTEAWLHRHLFLPDGYALLMRKNGDHRHDVDVKPELLREVGIYPQQVLCILEDRNSMVKKWRELGFTCLQVNEGDF